LEKTARIFKPKEVLKNRLLRPNEVAKKGSGAFNQGSKRPSKIRGQKRPSKIRGQKDPPKSGVKKDPPKSGVKKTLQSAIRGQKRPSKAQSGVKKDPPKLNQGSKKTLQKPDFPQSPKKGLQKTLKRGQF